MIKFTAGLIAVSALCMSVASAAPRTQTTALADAELFISPCGQPFRSKPGEPYPVVAWFQKVDTNKDGHIDRAEFRADAEAFFKVLDRDHDGILDDTEVSYYEHNIVPEVMGTPQASRLDGRARVILAALAQDESGSSSSSKIREDDLPFQGAGAYGLLNDSEPVRSADREFNGRIKLADFLARADHNFDALDSDGRGYLTLEDLPHTSAQDRARLARRKA
jgi:EF hand